MLSSNYKSSNRNVTGGNNWDSTQEPTLKCTNKTRDLFTGPNAQGTIDSEGNEIKGNNALETPVGLITMDEAIYAGGLAGNNNYGYWLHTGANYWTMSPYFFNGSIAHVFIVNSDGALTGIHVSYNYGIRPVINLKSDTKFTFTDGEDIGTSSNPYIVQ